MKHNHHAIHENVVHRAYYSMPTIVCGEGVVLYDRDGNCYLDGSSGPAAVNNLGFGVREVCEAMCEQSCR